LITKIVPGKPDQTIDKASYQNPPIPKNGKISTWVGWYNA